MRTCTGACWRNATEELLDSRRIAASAKITYMMAHILYSACAYRSVAGRVGLHAVGLTIDQLRRLAYSFRMLFFAGDALMALPPEHLPPPTYMKPILCGQGTGAGTLNGVG